MTHFAVDAGFTELQVLRPGALLLRAPQLAGVTGRTIDLVVRAGRETMEAVEIGALRLGRVDDLPIIEPGLFEKVVLNGEHVNLTVGRLCGVGLLPLGPDRIVDAVALPGALGAPRFEEVPALFDSHSGHWDSGLALELLSVEVSEHIFRTVGPEHAGHARALPRPVL